MKPLALERYEIRRELGRGGTSIVYEAYDTRDGAVVALKTIESPVADNLLRLKQEFRSLADVHHRNLVRYGELASEGDRWFFTMEIVRGRNFVDYVHPNAVGFDRHDVTRSEARMARRPASASFGAARPISSVPPPMGPTFDEGRLRSACAQLASALSAVHAAGHVHRDVKPSNVLVTDEGRVVLLDFGLAATLALCAAPDLDWVVGTPAFMAPEQAEGGAVGPEADWYAMGVMLFVALTGALPFDGTTADILSAKRTRDAPPVRARAPNVPEDLDALCAALLRRSPSERPRGDEIAARLGLAASEQFPSATRSSDRIPRFVGRAPELGVLESALAEVRAGAGDGRRVLVEGEPGIGKSALVNQFVGALGRDGRRDVLVLSGRCYEQESVPFKGIDGIVDALSDHLVGLPDSKIQPLLLGGVRYLATIFPVLRRVPAIARLASSREVADPSALREQAFGELERLIAALAVERPLVLFVDDLQWADVDSLELLERVLLGEDAAPVLFLATLRTGGDAAWGPRELTRRATRLSVAALTPAESGALLDALSSRRDEGGAMREALIREAAGHPLFLAELARSARAEGFAFDGQTKLEDVLWGRVAERDLVDRSLLEMLAIAGAPIPYDIVARAAGVDVGECQNRLGSLRAAQLLRVGRRGHERLIEPYHDRIREAIVGRLATGGAGGAATTELHLRLARALHSGTPEAELPSRVFAIVHHLELARGLLVDPAERTQAAALFLLATRQAQLATAYARAADYARTGLALLGDAAWDVAYEATRDLHLARMAAELFAGDAAAAEACFHDACAKVTSSTDKTALYVAWIGLQTSRGQLTEAVATGRRRLRELGTRVPEPVSKVAVLTQYVACRYLQGRRLTSDLLHLPKLADADREGIIELVVAMAPAAFFLDTNLLAWLELEGVAISLRHGVSDVSSYSFAVFGTVLTAVFGKHEEGEAFGRLALALNERFQNRRLAARLHFLYGGWHASWVRPFHDGVELLRTANELATRHGDTAYETYSASTRALIEFSASRDLASLKETSLWAQEVGVRRRDADMAGFAEVFARYSSALRGETPSPADLSLAGSPDAEFRAGFSDAKTPSSTYYAFACGAELAYLAGDAARALPLLEEAWKRPQIIFGLPTAVDLHFVDALVAARLHDGAPWAERLTLRRRVASRVAKLRDWARSCAANFEPYHLVASAELARIRGNDREARESFERAVTAARAHHSAKREAIALELGWRFEEGCGDAARAATWRRDASEAYRRWGAEAKARAIERPAP